MSLSLVVVHVFVSLLPIRLSGSNVGLNTALRLSYRYSAFVLAEIEASAEIVHFAELISIECFSCFMFILLFESPRLGSYVNCGYTVFLTQEQQRENFSAIIITLLLLFNTDIFCSSVSFDEELTVSDFIHVSRRPQVALSYVCARLIRKARIQIERRKKKKTDIESLEVYIESHQRSISRVQSEKSPESKKRRTFLCLLVSYSNEQIADNEQQSPLFAPTLCPHVCSDTKCLSFFLA